MDQLKNSLKISSSSGRRLRKVLKCHWSRSIREKNTTSNIKTVVSLRPSRLSGTRNSLSINVKLSSRWRSSGKDMRFNFCSFASISKNPTLRSISLRLTCSTSKQSSNISSNKKSKFQIALTNMILYSYPEVTRVTKTIRKLQKKEEAKFLKTRGDSIEIQINHVIVKHENEVSSLDQNLNQGWAEQDKIR